MLFHYHDIAEILTRLHREYRSARRSKKPIALLITNPEPWCEDRDIYEKTIRYFTEQGEDISHIIYRLRPRRVEAYAKVIRKEKTCVVVDRMIQIENGEISRSSIRNLEETHELVHNFITCISRDDRRAIPEIQDRLNRIGFNVVLFEFRRNTRNSCGTRAIERVMNDTNPGNREMEIIIASQELPGEPELYAGTYGVPVYLNGVKIYESHEACDYLDKMVLLCPGCFKAVTFGRDDEAHPFEKARPVGVGELDELDRVSTKRGFAHHTRLCRPAFPQDGISKVVTDRQQTMVIQLARLSKGEQPGDFQMVDASFFKGGEGTAYVYVKDRAPISFVAFRRLDIPGLGSTHVLWFLFTLPYYRSQKLATSVLNHGIQDLKINRERLPVLLPLTEFSKNIIRNASTRSIIDDDGSVIPRDQIFRYVISSPECPSNTE